MEIRRDLWTQTWCLHGVSPHFGRLFNGYRWGWHRTNARPDAVGNGYRRSTDTLHLHFCAVSPSDSKRASLFFSKNVKQVIRKEQWSTMAMVLVLVLVFGSLKFRAAVWADLQMFVPNVASVYTKKFFLLANRTHLKPTTGHSTAHRPPLSTHGFNETRSLKVPP